MRMSQMDNWNQGGFWETNGAQTYELQCITADFEMTTT